MSFKIYQKLTKFAYDDSLLCCKNSRFISKSTYLVRTTITYNSVSDIGLKVWAEND